MRDLNSILTSLVFLHALWTAPLLVKCIPAEGRFLVEVIGRDPCHPSQPAVPLFAGQHHDSHAACIHNSFTDPCLDLLLDAPGGTLVLVDSLSSPQQGRDMLTRPLNSCAHADFIVMESDRNYFMADVFDQYPRLRLPLRI